MTNKEFDTMVRTSAQKEVFRMTEHVEDHIKRKTKERITPKQIRRFTARTAVLAAVLLVLLTATAFAVANIPGVVDMLERFFQHDRAEQLKQEVSQPINQSYDLADVSITLSDVIFDGNTLYAAGRVSSKEGSNAIVLSFENTPAYAFGYNEMMGETPPEGTPTIAEVAQERGAKIIKTDVYVSVENVSGESAFDWLANSDGSYDFWYEMPGAIVDDEDMLTVTLSAAQWEINDEDITIDGTYQREAWTLRVPAVAREMSTSTPEPTQTPMPQEQLNGALRVLGLTDDRLKSAYHNSHPNQAVAYEDIAWDGNGQAMTEQQIETGEWDVCVVNTRTNAGLLEKLISEGTAYNLLTSDNLRAWQERLYPAASQYVGGDGEMYAAPITLYFDMNGEFVLTSQIPYGDLNVWQALGFTDADVPETLDELFVLITKYASAPKTGIKQTVFSGQGSNVRSWLLQMAIDLAVAEADDKPVTFQTQRMHDLLERLNEAASMLKGEKEYGNALVDICGGLQGAQHASVLRLFDDSPKRTYALMDVLVVNANSPHISQAVAYVETIVANMGYQPRGLLDAQVTFDELEAVALAEDVYYHQSFAEISQQRADNATNERTRKEEQETADAQLEAIERIVEGAKERSYLGWVHITYPEDLQAYRESIAPYLTFSTVRRGDVFLDNQAYNDLLNRYMSGGIDTDEFLKALDDMAS